MICIYDDNNNADNNNDNVSNDNDNNDKCNSVEFLHCIHITY